jgi:hypothetical protein
MFFKKAKNASAEVNPAQSLKSGDTPAAANVTPFNASEKEMTSDYSE